MNLHAAAYNYLVLADTTNKFVIVTSFTFLSAYIKYILYNFFSLIVHKYISINLLCIDKKIC